MASAVEGRHGVLCALGAASPLRRDPTLVEGVRHIVSAMEQGGVRRLVYLSFLGSPKAGVSSVWSVDMWLHHCCYATLWPITRRRNGSSEGAAWSGSSYAHGD